MGLRASALQLLLPHLPRDRVLSLSYPDMVLSQAELEALTGFRTLAENTAGGKWHGLEHPLPETVEVFARLGTEHFRCVDIVRSRKVEEIVDLNYPQDLGRHDLVIDPGTTEHCFNVGQALVNAADAVDEGGLILHTAPLTMLNHGFYCLMPTLFNDFYGQNGWEILFLQAANGKQLAEVPTKNRFTADAEWSLYCLARRGKREALRFPTQQKYLDTPTLQ